MSEEATRQTGRKKLKRWIGIPLGILLVIAGGLLVYRESRLWGLPDIGDPFDVEAFGRVEIADAENAVLEYREAELLIQDFPRNQDDNLDEILEKGWSSASPEIRQWVEDNRPALEVWIKGTEKPRALYCQPKDMSYEYLIAVRENRDLARMGGLEAARLESEQDFINAWELHRAGVRYSQHLGMHDAIARLVGTGFFAMYLPGIVRWSHHPQVSEDMLRQAIKDLQADFQMTPPISRTLKIEYLSDKKTQRTLEYWKQMFEVRETIRENFFVEPGKPVSDTILFLNHEPELSWRVIQLAYQNWFAYFDRPRHEYAFRPREKGNGDPFEVINNPGYVGGVDLFEPVNPEEEVNLFPPEKIEKFYQRCLLVRKIPLSPSGLLDSDSRNKARQGVLLVILAAQLHYREHGQFPEQAADLLGSSFKEFPPDTLSDQPVPIKYRRLAEDRCVIWSAGGNHVDDGGKIDRSWSDDDMDFGFEIGAGG